MVSPSDQTAILGSRVLTPLVAVVLLGVTARPGVRVAPTG